MDADRLQKREKYLNEQFGVCTRHTKAKGTHLVATRSFQQGDVVLDSPPFAFVLGEGMEGERCEQCFVRGTPEAPLLLCTACKAARYCGAACQQAAWAAHHKVECCISEGISSVCRQVPPHVVPELRLLLRVALLSMSHPPPQDQGAEYRQSFADVLNMPSNTEHLRSTDPQRFHGNAEIASLVASLLRSPRLSKKKKTIDLSLMPQQGDLERLLERFGFNDFAIWDELIISVGSGVYPLGAILNHSCSPNCVLYYCPQSHRQMIRVIRPVSEGQELCHSYTDVASPTSERRSRLSFCYGFSCDCSRCTEGGDLDGKLVGTCDIDKSDEDYVEGVRLLDEGESVVDMKRGCEKLAKVSEGWREGRDACNLDMVALRSRLLTGWLEAGENKRAIPVCEEQVGAYRTIYGPMHPLLGLQMYTWGNLLVDTEEERLVRDGVERLREAREVLCVTHGRGSATVQGLDSLIEQYG